MSATKLTFDYKRGSALSTYFKGGHDHGHFETEWQAIVPPLPNAMAMVTATLVYVKPSPDGVHRYSYNVEVDEYGSKCRVHVYAWRHCQPKGMRFNVLLVQDASAQIQAALAPLLSENQALRGRLDAATGIIKKREVQTYMVDLHNALSADDIRKLLHEKFELANKFSLDGKQDYLLVIQHGATKPGKDGEGESNPSKNIAIQWMKSKEIRFSKGEKPNTLVHRISYRVPSPIRN